MFAIPKSCTRGRASSIVNFPSFFIAMIILMKYWMSAAMKYKRCT